ncbi:DNA-binding transcriptional regulator Nlp [compost metagenome]
MEREFKDWHRADILAGVRKTGITLAGLSRKAGLGDSTLANAFARPWPRGEKIIADAIGVEPWVIWPSRYYDPNTGAFIDRLSKMRVRRKKPD